MFRERKKAESVTARSEITIANELGLHARPAAEFARCAHRFRSEIFIVKNTTRFSATSLIEILRANLEKGETAVLEAHGPDAQEAVSALLKLASEFRD